MRNYKVAHIIAPENVGGAETVVRKLAEVSVIAGYNVEVIAILPRDNNSLFIKNLSLTNVPIREIRSNKRDYLCEIKTLRRALHDRNVDIIHTHLYHADVIGYLAAHPIGIPCVSTVHGFTGTGLKTAFYVWLDSIALKRFNAVICVSRSLKERMENIGCKRERIHLVQNGFKAPMPISKIEARAELGLPMNKICVGWVGRISHEKGVDLFVEAIANLKREDVLGVIVGEGNKKQSILHKINKLGVGKKVVLTGQHPDASRIFSAFDVFVISSRSEANPMVVLEAFWAKIPIVAFRVGDIEDMLDESSARLVSNGDTKKLAESINDLLMDQNLTSGFIKNATEKIENEFNISRWIDKHNKIYERVLTA